MSPVSLSITTPRTALSLVPVTIVFSASSSVTRAAPRPDQAPQPSHQGGLFSTLKYEHHYPLEIDTAWTFVEQIVLPPALRRDPPRGPSVSLAPLEACPAHLNYDQFWPERIQEPSPGTFLHSSCRSSGTLASSEHLDRFCQTEAHQMH